MRALAKRFRGTISSIELYDANVCTWTHPPDRPWEFTVVSGEPFSKQLQYSYGGRKIKVLANNNFLYFSIAASIPAQPLSVNERNLIDPLVQEARGGTIDDSTRYPVFTRTGNLSFDQRALVGSTEFRSLLRELDLHTGEKLNIFSDEISACLKKPTVEWVTRLMEEMLNLVNHLEVPPEELDLTVLPAQFHPLIPLIKKWAIADDSDREDFLVNFPKAVLERFVAKVEPYLNPIDSYLDSLGDRPPSEQACALGRLAECAVEAKRYLEGRVAGP